MSALTFDPWILAAWSAALLASLTGSLHCLGMCGPIRLLAGEKLAGRAQYQGGRLVSYLLLGAMAGGVGASIPLWLIVALLGIGLLFQLGSVRIPQLSRARQNLLSLAAIHPFLFGAASGLLPCGMLHAWLGAAALTSAAAHGAILLFLLWLGTLPALELSARVLRAPLEKLRLKYPRALPVLLLLFALIPLGMRMGWASLDKSAPPPHCHHHQTTSP